MTAGRGAATDQTCSSRRGNRPGLHRQVRKPPRRTAGFARPSLAVVTNKAPPHPYTCTSAPSPQTASTSARASLASNPVLWWPVQGPDLGRVWRLGFSWRLGCWAGGLAQQWQRGRLRACRPSGAAPARWTAAAHGRGHRGRGAGRQQCPPGACSVLVQTDASLVTPPPRAPPKARSQRHPPVVVAQHRHAAPRQVGRDVVEVVGRGKRAPHDQQARGGGPRGQEGPPAGWAGGVAGWAVVRHALPWARTPRACRWAEGVAPRKTGAALSRPGHASPL